MKKLIKNIRDFCSPSEKSPEISREVITRTYHSFEKELTSLKDYDSGKKKIDAPDLRDLVQRV